VASLSTDFLPSSWDYYSPTAWDIATYIGTFGLFFTFFLLFLRFLPMVAIAEVKGVMPQADPHNYDDETQEFIEENMEPAMVKQEKTV
ncbi:MAG TPA: hydrogenase, partial [Balneolaceae bacterium]|nr:hydrogenase [Balneolaceae bacterium]